MWGPELKFAGWDGLLVTGQVEKPVYLLIEDDRVQICPAEDLWGRETGEVDALLGAAFEQGKVTDRASG